VELREKIKDFFSRDVLWPPNVIVEILVDVAISRSHLISLYLILEIGYFSLRHLQ
jgi:hypothetical protein